MYKKGHGLHELAYAIFAVGAVFVLKLTPPIPLIGRRKNNERNRSRGNQEKT